MRSQVRSLNACLLFTGAPAYAGAQELSLDAKSFGAPAGNAMPTFNRGAKAGLKKAKGIGAVRLAAPAPARETKDFSWSGSYGGLHAGGAFSPTGQSDP
jgi:hypothetical protein